MLLVVDLAIGAPLVGVPSIVSSQDIEATEALSKTARRVVDPSVYSRGELSIHVFGEVEMPGTYSLRRSERALTAIQLAEGFTEKASKSKVELRRGRSKPKTCDFLDLYRTGDLRQNPFVQDNDVIFVPRLERAVRIQGAIKKPDVYEVSTKATIADVVALAEGYTVGFDSTQSIKIIRYLESGEKDALKVDPQGAAFSSTQVIDGDTIHIPHKFTAKHQFDDSVAMLPNDEIAFPTDTASVFVLGGVKNAGAFQFNPHFRLNAYMSLAGGLDVRGKTEAKIVRADGSVEESNIYSNALLSPGDSVVVAERKISPEFWMTFFLGFVSVSLSTVAIITR